MKLLLSLTPLLLSAIYCTASARPDSLPLSSLTPFPDSPIIRTLTVYIRLPIAAFPGLRFHPLTGSPGLVFIALHASGERDSVTQYMAFSPLQPTAALLSNRPVPATLTDESLQAYHGYIRITLSIKEWDAVLKQIQHWARFVPYRRDSSNSTNFACEVLRQLRTSQPNLHPPSAHSPGELYRWVESSQKQTPAVAGQCHVGKQKLYAGSSYVALHPLISPPLTSNHHE